MKKRVLIINLILFIVAFASSGCATGEAVELSEDDRNRVADYSSDILSQHNEYSNSRVVPIEEARWEYQKMIDLEAKKKNFVAMQQAASGELPPEGMDGSSESGGTSESADAIPVPTMTLAEAIDIPEFDVEYRGYETLVSYPDSSVSDNLVMGMTAAQGDVLLVVHFDVTNNSGYEQECDVLSQKPQFRLRVNGDRKTLQQTILTNDLSKLTTIMAPGETVDAVLICEMSQDDASVINELSLIVRSAEGRPEYVLEG